MSKSAAVATIEPSAYAMMSANPHEMMAIMKENLAGQEMNAFSLPRIKMPTAGGTFWSLSGPDGEEAAKHFDGVICHQTFWRSYWEKRMGEDGEMGQAPQCFSRDALVGEGNPGGLCRKCPLSQFGPNREKPPCKLMRLLFVLREQDALPTLLAVPPTSLAPVQAYMTALSGTVTPYYGVVTRFSLEKATNSGQIAYAKLALSRVGSLGPAETARAREYKAAVEGLLTADMPTTGNGNPAPVIGDDLVEETF